MKLIVILIVISIAQNLYGQKKQEDNFILINNVEIFNGTDEKPVRGNVLIKNNLIDKVSTSPITVDKNATQIIDGEGKFVMPGLIDAHWHAMMAPIPMMTLLTADLGYINLVAGKQAEETLLRGFTSVRDMAGPSFGLKRAIDESLIPGPRIWPSGAMISQTGGHGDFRLPYEVPKAPNASLSRGEVIGGGIIADGPDEVRMRTREQLMMGASQIKLAAGGGVSSLYDPIDASQYTEPEIRAAVEAAENWGTYVTVHAYTSRAIQTAISAGVKCIEHGQLMDEATAKLMAENDIWLSIQPFLDNEYSNPQTTDEGRAKQLQVYAGTDSAYVLAKKYNLKTAWGTDILFDPEKPANQGAILATMTRWYTPFEILKMATSTNGELLAMAGPRSPYPGKIGVIEEGAYADILLVDGNPLEDIEVIANPEKNLLLIIKNGLIYKDLLSSPPTTGGQKTTVKQ